MLLILRSCFWVLLAFGYIALCKAIGWYIIIPTCIVLYIFLALCKAGAIADEKMSEIFAKHWIGKSRGINEDTSIR